MSSHGRSVESVAALRRGLSGVLVIAALIFGVVTMHSMSGSPTSHVSSPVLGAMVQMDTEPSAADAGHEPMPSGAGLTGSHELSAGADGLHDLVTAMCVMVLVALVVLALPLSRVFRWLTLVRSPGRRVARRWARTALRGSPPSLITLGISRT